jgi:hypothetical protein
MTEPAQTAEPALVSATGDTLIPAPAETPRAEDVLTPSVPPPVIQLTAEDVEELIQVKRSGVQSATDARDAAKAALDNAQEELDRKRLDLGQLQQVAKGTGRVILTATS